MARQTSITATAIIPVPPERVWEIACDSSRYPQWVENTLRMIHTDGHLSIDRLAVEDAPERMFWAHRIALNRLA